MKKPLLLLIVCCLLIAACKKASTSAPAIIGTWSLSGLSGMDSFNFPPQYLSQVTTYSFNSATDSMTSSTIDSGSATPLVISAKVTNETWTFNANGTYTINETFSGPGADNQSLTDTGEWRYADNASNDSVFLIEGQVSSALQYVVPIITSTNYYYYHVSGNTLTLSNNLVQYYGSGYEDSARIDVSFTKQ